eukprot:scaffold194310_cov31-Tisochrysis_lutea.AAC.3
MGTYVPADRYHRFVRTPRCAIRPIPFPSRYAHWGAAPDKYDICRTGKSHVYQIPAKVLPQKEKRKQHQ